MKQAILALTVMFVGTIAVPTVGRAQVNTQSEQSACTSRLCGVYDVEMTIGELTYQDRLEITEAPKSGRGDVRGTFTVPGSFTAPFEGLVSRPCWGGSCEVFVISFFASEGGQVYRVRMQGESDYYPPAPYTGEAYLESGELFGRFKMRRHSEAGKHP